VFANDIAITLKRVKFEDRHQILTLLTLNHGKISAMAHNSIHSRRFGSALQLYEVSECRLFKRNNQNTFRIESANSKERFSNIPKNWMAYINACFFSELILNLIPENETDPNLFKLFYNGLKTLDSLNSTASLPIQVSFLGKLLQRSGHQPSIISCASCGKLKTSPSINLSITAGGRVCCEPSDFSVQLTSIEQYLTLLKTPLRSALSLTDYLHADFEKLFQFQLGILTEFAPEARLEEMKSLKLLNDHKSNSQPQLMSLQ